MRFLIHFWTSATKGHAVAEMRLQVRVEVEVSDTGAMQDYEMAMQGNALASAEAIILARSMVSPGTKLQIVHIVREK